MDENDTKLNDDTLVEGADFAFDSEYETLSPAERRKKVEAALFDAACSGNVTAALKFLETDPQSPAADLPTPSKRKAKPPPAKKITLKEWRFIHAYFGEANGDQALAAAIAGYKGNVVSRSVTGHRLLKKPKIAQVVAAMLEQSALSVDQVLKGISEIALGGVEAFLEFGKDEDPSMTLRRARDAGKLGLVKGLEFYRKSEGGGVKRIIWYDKLIALKALGMFHHSIKPPEKPPVEEPDAEDLEAAEYEAARNALLLIYKRAKELGREISETQARELAARRFPKAADVPMPTTIIEGNM